MVETINPVVHGGRRAGWAIDVVLHAAGATLAAGAFGAALGGLGALLGAPWGAGGALVVAIVAGVYAAGELAGIRIPVPQARRQVPDWWRTFFSRPAFSFLYGVGLGAGFFTYLARGTLVAVAGAAVASGKPLLGAAVMAPFGLARGLSVLVASGARTRESAAALVDRLVASADAWGWRAANGAVLAAVASASWIAAADAWDLGVEELAAAILAAAFGWAALAKALHPSAWRRALRGHDLPASLVRRALLLIPLAEGSVALLAVAGFGGAAGILALSMLVVFSAVVLRTRRLHGADVPCGCFGERRVLDYRIALARNGMLALVALAAIADGSGARAMSLPGVPGPAQLLPAALAVVGLTVAAWMARQASVWLRAGRRT